MKIARGNLERSLFTGFICHTTLPSSTSLEILGKLLSVRLYCNNDNKKQKPQKAISTKNAFSNKVKIGRKIYIFPKARIDQSSVSNIEKPEVSAETSLEKKENIIADNHRSSPSQVSSKESDNYLKCGEKEEKQSKGAEKDVSKFQEIKNVCKPSLPFETQDKSKTSTITASQSSFVSSAPLRMPSPTVLNSILNFPLFDKLENKSFMPAEQQENLVTFSNHTIYKPSVLEVLNTTRSPESSENLARWEEDNIRKLGVDGFQEFSQGLKQEGIDFHNLIKEYLQNGDETLAKISPAVKACWKSLKPVLKDINIVHCLESKVVHPQLIYSGYIDCIATFKSKPVLIEWKKSSRKRSRLDFTYDNPLQLVAYMGAVNFDPAYAFQMKDCLLVFAYTDGSSADVFTISNQEAKMYWTQWLGRLQQYWQMQGGNSAQSNAATRLSEPSVSSRQEHASSSIKTDLENNALLKRKNHEITQSNESMHSTNQEKPIADNTSAPCHKLNLEPQQKTKMKDMSSKELRSEVQKNEKKPASQSQEGLLNTLWKFWKF